MIGKDDGGVQKWIGLAITGAAGISIIIAVSVYAGIIIDDMYPPPTTTTSATTTATTMTTTTKIITTIQTTATTATTTTTAASTDPQENSTSTTSTTTAQITDENVEAGLRRLGLVEMADRLSTAGLFGGVLSGDSDMTLGCNSIDTLNFGPYSGPNSVLGHSKFRHV